MANKRYERGYRAELKAVRLLQAAGYWAERSHASKGTFDILASNLNETLLIQVKRSKTPYKTIRAIYRANRDDIKHMQAVPHPASTRIELWLYTDPQPGSATGTWQRFSVHPDGLAEIPMIQKVVA